MKLVATNKQTREKIEVNPQDENDVYWTLDKRMWVLAEEEEDRTPVTNAN